MKPTSDRTSDELELAGAKIERRLAALLAQLEPWQRESFMVAVVRRIEMSARVALEAASERERAVARLDEIAAEDPRLAAQAALAESRALHATIDLLDEILSACSETAILEYEPREIVPEELRKARARLAALVAWVGGTSDGAPTADELAEAKRVRDELDAARVP